MTTTESAAIPTLRALFEKAKAEQYKPETARGLYLKNADGSFQVSGIELGFRDWADGYRAALAATPALPVPAMTILPWDQRMEGNFPYGTVPHINAMQGEIADLRDALAAKIAPVPALTDERIAAIYEQTTGYPLKDEDYHGAIAFGIAIEAELRASIAAPASAPPADEGAKSALYAIAHTLDDHELRAAAKTAYEAIAAPASATVDRNVQLDADRWRALLASPRIRMIGSAGLRRPEPNHYAHFGMEIWTQYGRDYKPELLAEMDSGNALGKEWLTKYADIAIEARLAEQSTDAPAPPQPLTSSPTEESK